MGALQRWRWTVAVAVAVGAVLSACSGEPSRREVRRRAPGLVRESDYLVFFQHPASFRAQDGLLQEAQNRLTERCLAAKGFDVRYPEAEVDQIIGQVTPQMAFRREWGYGFTAPKPISLGLEPKDLDEFERIALATTGDMAKQVWVRAPVGRVSMGLEGCLGEARSALYGSVRRSILGFILPGDYSNFIGRKVGADPAWAKAMVEWSACMGSRGHALADLDAAYMPFFWIYEYADPKPTRPTAEEIEVAVDDGECALRIGLPALTRRLQVIHVRSLSRHQRAELRAMVRIRRGALEEAERIVLDR